LRGRRRALPAGTRSIDVDIAVCVSFLELPSVSRICHAALSAVAERISPDYVEEAGHVKLIRPEGEIDFAAPNLTTAGFKMWRIAGRDVRAETAVEIVAKKMWHRGATATARDLFDLALVIERERRALAAAARFLVRHRRQFLAQIALPSRRLARTVRRDRRDAIPPHLR
jgi:hypothetical protein